MSNETFEYLVKNICDNILDIDTKNVKCFLCDETFVTGDKSFLLFNERLASDGTGAECPLADILSSALNMNVEEPTAHSSLLCSNCNYIVLDYERMDQQLNHLRMSILKAYNKTILQLSELSMSVVKEEKETNEEENDLISENLNSVDNFYEIIEMVDESEEISNSNDNISNEEFNFEETLTYEETLELDNLEFQSEIHEEIGLDKIKYQCEICNCCFEHSSLLYKHQEIQHKKKLKDSRERHFKCDECEKAFLTLRNLNSHKSIHSREKLFICEICSKAFVTQHNLDAHRFVHSGIRPYECSFCKKSFARRAEVTLHERTHTGDRPFKCDICPMAFAQRSNLWAHKKTTHFMEKRHKCEICERTFKRRRLLDYHTQAVHTGERPYKCELCNSSFVYPEHYKKHMNIHTDERPFACEVCGKRFNSRDNRNAHRFVHSDKKLYECIKCGAGFMRKPLLLAHMKQYDHNGDAIIVNKPQITKIDNETTTMIIQSYEVDQNSFVDSGIQNEGS